MEYFIGWLHIYFIHFCALVTFSLAATVMKDGLPELKEVPKLILTAVVMAVVMGFFSSHSHAHFLNQLIK